jgi:hypothetical protein
MRAQKFVRLSLNRLLFVSHLLKKFELSEETRELSHFIEDGSAVLLINT